jgi:hypothetical protein
MTVDFCRISQVCNESIFYRNHSIEVRVTKL